MLMLMPDQPILGFLSRRGWLRLAVRVLQLREVDITVRTALLRGLVVDEAPGPTLLAHRASEDKDMKKYREPQKVKGMALT
jgi:hypothetical protein